MPEYQLTPEEMTLVIRADWLLAKNRIIDKVYELFGELHRRLHPLAEASGFEFPENCLRNGAKISRGEKYRGLPYVILDDPRLFTRNSVFAFRVLFWWGHFFSCTLHLSGEAKKQFAPTLKNHFGELQQHHFYLGTGSEEWSHHYEEDNYRPLENMKAADFERFTGEMEFIRLSRRFPLEAWEAIIPSALQSFELLLRSLRI